MNTRDNRAYASSTRQHARRLRHLRSRSLILESLEQRTLLAVDFAWPMEFVDVAGTVFFTAESSEAGRELWKTDGTEEGTVLVKDIRPGVFGSSPEQLINVDGTLFFRATDGSSGVELWSSDGTEEGTVMVKNLRPGGLGSYPNQFTISGGTLFFTANNGVHGTELWKSDGTDAGTIMVWDIRDGSAGSFPGQLVDVDGTLYFHANHGTSGVELWKSDGTAAGTMIVKDIRAGSDGSIPTELTNVDGTLFFVANDGTGGIELWKSDGTGLGTEMVKDILAGSGGSSPSQLMNVGGTLFFRANDDLHGAELWKSDGTEIGTFMVKDILTGTTGSSLRELTDVAGTLYFGTNDGTNGWELWKSDGTEEGTALVKDIVTGATGSNPLELTEISGVLYFRADDEIHGTELWTTDGTEVGTVMVKDIREGGWGSYPRHLANIDGTLYFRAFDVIAGTELWISDGTESGTELIKGNSAGRTLTFSIAENNKKTDGTTLVGTIRPLLEYAGQTFTFNSVPGGDEESFTVDSSGNIRLAEGLSLDHETKSSYTFNVEVEDSADASKVTTATVTVSVLDINEAPTYTLVDSEGAAVEITNRIAVLTLDENIPGNLTKNGLVIGTLSVSDQDAGDVLTDAMAPDRTGAFGYDPLTGEISIIDETKISYELSRSIRLSFTLMDDGTPSPQTTRLSVVVNLNDLNEAPVVSGPSSMTIAENNRAAARVGKINARDADTRAVTKQTLTYSIVSQKDATDTDVSIFSIESTKGSLSIPTAGLLDFESNGSYTLVVRVTDDGTPPLSTDHSMTVTVIDINEAATFSVSDTDDIALVAPFALTVNKLTVDDGEKIGRVTYTDVDAGAAGTYDTAAITASIEAASNGALTWDPGTGDLTVLDKSKLTRTFSLRIRIQDTAIKKVRSSVAIAIQLV
jgi:ELWxxDGT repeat protein